MPSPHSLSEQVSLACPRCGVPSSVELWRIVDLTERPDLGARIVEDSINKFPCQSCGADESAAVLILIFWPEAPLPQMRFQYLAAPTMTPMRLEQELDRLLALLRENSGADWHPEWLSHGIMPNTRDSLADMLSEGFVENLRHLAMDKAYELRGSFIEKRQIERLHQSNHAFSTALSLTSANDPLRLELLDALGRGLWIQYAESRDSAALDEAIATFEEALAKCPGADRSTSLLVHYSVALEDRAARDGSLHDQNAAIAHFEIAVANTKETHERYCATVSGLALALGKRFDLIGDPLDLERAVSLHQRAIRSSKPDSPDLPGLEANLRLARAKLGQIPATSPGDHAKPGHDDVRSSESPGARAASLLQQYARSPESGLLDESIELGKRAVDLAENDVAGLWRYLLNLASAARMRFDKTQDRIDLELATESLIRGSNLATQSVVGLADILFKLGIDWMRQQDRTKSRPDQDKVVNCFERCVTATPHDSEDLARRLLFLGLALAARFRLSSDPQDLDGAIARLHESAERAPAGSEVRGAALDNYVRAMAERYDQFLDADRVESMIAACVEALAIRNGPAQSAGIKMNLGILLRQRHLLDGKKEDLDASIADLNESLPCFPSNSTERLRCLTNLGNSLYDLYVRTGNLTHLNEAIACWREAVDSTESGSPARRLRLTNLADGIRTRYRHSAKAEDLDEAISLLELADRETPADSWDKSRHLAILAVALIGSSCQPTRAEGEAGPAPSDYRIGGGRSPRRARIRDRYDRGMRARDCQVLCLSRAGSRGRPSGGDRTTPTRDRRGDAG